MSKIIYVDIDDTICKRDCKNLDYNKAYPIRDRIDKINKLYDNGNRIVYWSARGTVTGKDWLGVTLSQLQVWGCKFHQLKLGKPYYDLFIDDKNINSEIYFSKINEKISK